MSLTNPRGVPFALSNEFDNLYDFKEDVEDCQTTDELLRVVRKYGSCYNLRLEKDRDKYTRFAFEDCWGNTHYLIVYKKQLTESKRRRVDFHK